MHATACVFSKGGGEMVKDATPPEVNEPRHFAKSVRLLWEGRRQVCYGGAIQTSLRPCVRLSRDWLNTVSGVCSLPLAQPSSPLPSSSFRITTSPR